jgi:hypothetical protein
VREDDLTADHVEIFWRRGKMIDERLEEKSTE